MNNPLSEKQTILLIYVFFLAGALWNSLGVLQDFMQLTTPLILAASAVIMLLLTYRITQRAVVVFAGIFVGTWAIEALGVATGFPFGTYEYTGTLGLQVLGVSLIIPFAWLLVIAASDAFVGHFMGRISTTLVAVMATLFDFFLEFAADVLDYWHWSTRFPPASNYASWFVISFAAALLLRDTVVRREELRIPAHIYIAQVLYFCITFIGMKSGFVAL
ncbi:MAG: carotenoid biosynthesis protein [Bacteroidota bacterium]|nr:carotenoid biosynthesis protein [Bacteroidota bacterium]